MEMYYAFIAGVLIGMFSVTIVKAVKIFFNWRRSSCKSIEKSQKKRFKNF